MISDFIKPWQDGVRRARSVCIFCDGQLAVCHKTQIITLCWFIQMYTCNLFVMPKLKLFLSSHWQCFPFMGVWEIKMINKFIYWTKGLSERFFWGGWILFRKYKIFTNSFFSIWIWYIYISLSSFKLTILKTLLKFN